MAVAGNKHTDWGVQRHNTQQYHGVIYWYELQPSTHRLLQANRADKLHCKNWRQKLISFRIGNSTIIYIELYKLSQTNSHTKSNSHFVIKYSFQRFFTYCRGTKCKGKLFMTSTVKCSMRSFAKIYLYNIRTPDCSILIFCSYEHLELLQYRS